MARDTTKTPAQHRPGILHSHRNCLTVCSHDRCASFLCYSHWLLFFLDMIIAYRYEIVKGSLQICDALLYGNCANFKGRFLLHLHNSLGAVSKAQTINLWNLPCRVFCSGMRVHIPRFFPPYTAYPAQKVRADQTDPHRPFSLLFYSAYRTNSSVWYSKITRLSGVTPSRNR